MLSLVLQSQAENRTYSPQVKTLQAVVNKDWLSPTVMRLYGNDFLNIAFDELSHDSHRYIYRLEHCEADWTGSEDIFEADWLEGFNDNVIEKFEHSINTVVPYTHYQLQIPNDRCRLKLSGNYRLYIIDDDTNETVASVEFMVTEQTMLLSMAATTNTDIDVNGSHQQVSFKLSYGDCQVTDVSEQFSIGDRVMVRITSIKGRDNQTTQFAVDASIRLAQTSKQEELLKTVHKGNIYTGRIADIRKGTFLIKLSNGSNALAHCSHSRRDVLKNDTVAFVVNHVDHKTLMITGQIIRIVKRERRFR